MAAQCSPEITCLCIMLHGAHFWHHLLWNTHGSQLFSWFWSQNWLMSLNKSFHFCQLWNAAVCLSPASCQQNHRWQELLIVIINTFTSHQKSRITLRSGPCYHSTEVSFILFSFQLPLFSVLPTTCSVLHSYWHDPLPISWWWQGYKGPSETEIKAF